MYERPLVIGVRQAAADSSTKTVQDLLYDLGQNTGNMMFTEGLSRTVKNARSSSFGYTDTDLEDRDCIILAAANWINNYSDFGWLADRLSQSKLPIFIVGIGAQAPADMKIPPVSPGTLKLLALASERSTSISTRGYFSSEVLDHYGFKNSTPTGCPSLLLAGSEGPHLNLDRKIAMENVCLHSTRHNFGKTSPFQKYLYVQAFKQQKDILLQSELADFYFALGRTGNPDILKQATEAVTEGYGNADIEKISAYLRKHGKVFFRYNEWIEYMRTRSLTVGTRIHGTISSILAGTPAILIAHDSRTIEMAVIMGIPYVLSSELNTEADLDVMALYDAEKQLDFVAGFPDYYKNFLSFFASNSINYA